MNYKAIHTNQAPKAIGPYSQAIQAGNLLFLSGQIGLDPVNAILVEGGCLNEFQQAIKNIQAILNTVNANLENIVKITLYLSDFKDFVAVNNAMKDLLKEPFPARTTIQAAKLPLGAAVELDVIALVD